MMSPSESYLASIAERLPQEDLDAVEADIEREEGPAALFRCLEARLAAEVKRGGSEEAILDARSRLASAGERVALSQEDGSAMRVAIQTFEIWRDVGDEEGCGRAACRALELALQTREQVQDVIEALGGREKALFWVRKNLRSSAIKKSPEKHAQVRHLAARMLEHAGEAEAAFLELLGAVRKMPAETVYIDEAYRLALDTNRYEEVTPIFSENAADADLPKAVRAALYMKLGYLEERCAARPERALEAFRAALKLRPKHKGTKRQVKRLEEVLKAPRVHAEPTASKEASSHNHVAESTSEIPPSDALVPQSEAVAPEEAVAPASSPEEIAIPHASDEEREDSTSLAHHAGLDSRAVDTGSLRSADAGFPPALPSADEEAAGFEDADELDVLEERPRIPSSLSAAAKKDAEAAAAGALPPPLPALDVTEGPQPIASEPPPVPAESEWAAEEETDTAEPAAHTTQKEPISLVDTESLPSKSEATEAGEELENSAAFATLYEEDAIIEDETDERIIVSATSEETNPGEVDDDTTAETLHPPSSDERDVHPTAALVVDVSGAKSPVVAQSLIVQSLVEEPLVEGVDVPTSVEAQARPPAVPDDELEELDDAEVTSLDTESAVSVAALRDSIAEAPEKDLGHDASEDSTLVVATTAIPSRLAAAEDAQDERHEIDVSAALSHVDEQDISSALESALDQAMEEAIGDVVTSASAASVSAEKAQIADKPTRAAERNEVEGTDVAARPRDEEQRAQALAKLTARLPGGAATRRLLTRPNEALLEEGYAFYRDTQPEELVVLPFSVRILFAIALLRRGEPGAALEILERLVQEQPTDLLCLRTLNDALEGNDERIEERLEAVKNLLLHHKRVLNDAEVLGYRATAGALQWRLGERESARSTLQQALIEAEEEQLHGAFTDEIAAATAAALVDDPVAKSAPATRVLALRFLAEHRHGLARAEVLERAAQIAVGELDDVAQSRSLLLQAIEAFPEGRSAPARLMDLDIQEGDVEAAIATTKAFLLTEAEPEKRGAHHLRLAELYIQTQAPTSEIHNHLCGAMEFEGVRDAAMELAERFFHAEQNLAGLDSFYVDAVVALKSASRERRLQVWRKLVELRRDVFSDLEATAEALEHVARLDTGSIQSRDECAQIYMTLGRFKDAVAMWRSILERAPLAKRAWRGLFSAYVSHGHGDEAFAVAAAMSSVELADEAMVRAVRLAAPEFPCWPQVPADPAELRHRLSHPLETPFLQQLFAALGETLHASQAAALKDFGLRKRDALTEKNLPPSIMGAAQKISAIMGLSAPPSLYLSPYGSADGRGSDFALLPVAEPSLLVSHEVVQHGMNPERAFAMGRAMGWLAPQAILAGTMSAPQLTEILESLVELLLGAGRGRGDATALKESAARLDKLFFGSAKNETNGVTKEILTNLVRRYEQNRDRIHLVDWFAGVGYTADRLGFLLVGDVTPATRVIKATAGEAQTLGARLAIKELVLFSASSVYLSLRQQLGLSLSAKDAEAILRLR